MNTYSTRHHWVAEALNQEHTTEYKAELNKVNYETL